MNALLQSGDSTGRAFLDARTGRWFTRADIRSLSDSLSAHLKFPRKALVFCFCRNRIEAIAAYLASLTAGHAVLLLDSQLNSDFIDSLVTLYRPDFILTPADDAKMLSAAVANSFTVTEARGVAVGRTRQPFQHDLHPDLAVLLSTSGSTGSPKLVRLSLANVVANAQSIAEALSITPAELAISSLSLHYSYGLSVINSHLVAGAAVALTDDSVTSGDFWKTARTAECTSFAGVPYMYQVLARLKFPSLNVPAIKTMTQAGGKLGNEMARSFHEMMSQRQGRFIIMYGQTEATARICVLPHEDLPARLGSCGKPIPGGSLKIEIEGKPATGGAPGELIYHGPNVMLGYAATAADLALGDTQHGRLRTGDIGHLDPDGFAFITGRAKRFSKVFGIRINLDEVETMLKSYGPTAIVGGEDRLLIFCEYGDADIFTACQRDLAAKLNLHPRALDFRRVDKLPLTSSGKTDYPSLAVVV